MNLLITAFLLLVHNIKDLQAENSTENSFQNKTKRTISPTLVHNYGENKPVLFYNDNGASSSDFSNLYMPVTIKPVFDSEIPKQVAAQQVLYEFQQTPTNAVSNVHVNQFYQPVPAIGQKPQQNQQSTQTGSETVVNPVHHTSLIRHNQNLGPVQFQQQQQQQPSPIPHHVQTQQYIPGKYFYVNGKILYQPHQLNYHQQPIQLPRVPNYPIPQVAKQKILPQLSPLQHPTLLQRPVNYNNFHPPQQHQYQKITKPISTTGNNEENQKEEENDKIPAKEDDVEGDEDEEEESDDVDEESDDEDNDDEIEDSRNFFHKYSFEDDEDEDDHHHENDDDDDDDEDSSRKPSKQVTKKHKNKSKSNKFNDYKPSKPNKKKRQHKSPKIKYQAMKYTRNGNHKPKIEYIEGRQSKHIPVIHKQKVFKEKWYISKNTDDLAGA